MTHTGIRTGELTEGFVIMLRTLAPAVTDVCHVQTDSGATTAVETRTGWTFTLAFVFMIRAVVQTIAAHIEGQAVAIT